MVSDTAVAYIDLLIGFLTFSSENKYNNSEWPPFFAQVIRGSSAVDGKARPSELQLGICFFLYKCVSLNAEIFNGSSAYCRFRWGFRPRPRPNCLSSDNSLTSIVCICSHSIVLTII